MYQDLIVKDMINWIEDNLHRPLFLNEIAEKSGYTKWHMHRLFKHFSGYNLAEYIRARRLSKAAIELRLSHSLVFDIIMEYGFESQQTFTRTFKQHFGISPGQYRDQPHWKFSRLCPPLNLSLPQAPIQTCIRWLPDTHLTGNNYPFRCSFGELVNQREQRDVQIWKEFLHGVKTIPPCVFGLSQSKIAENGRMEYQYSIAVDQMAGSTLPYQEPVELQGGIYLCFIYTGQIPTIKNFIDYIYLTYLPIHEVTRRDGPDIEMYYFNELSRYGNDYIQCDYCIPVEGYSYVNKVTMNEITPPTVKVGDGEMLDIFHL